MIFYQIALPPLLLSLSNVASFTPTKPSIQRITNNNDISSNRIAFRPVGSVLYSSTIERPTATAVKSSVTKPNGMENPWEVHKFGGGTFICFA